MLDQPTLWGIMAGGMVGAVYLLLHLRQRSKPDLAKFAGLFLACVGTVVGGSFALLIFKLDLAPIPALKDQRLVMLLGAIAVTWISIEQIWTMFQQLQPDQRLVSQGDLSARTDPATSNSSSSSNMGSPRE
jgi:xanthosine utilization system XapX-like protein